ncbi:MAG: hypothetical protein AVDCRST_MAG83-12, partial [uncultured Arthrobacter sp.]
ARLGPSASPPRLREPPAGRPGRRQLHRTEGHPQRVRRVLHLRPASWRILREDRGHRHLRPRGVRQLRHRSRLANAPVRSGQGSPAV